VDPGIIFHLARQGNMTLGEIDTLLNKKSGLLGLSGVSNDVRALVEASAANERARLALDVFCYRIRKYIGAYLAALGRAHAVVFTGGIGENAIPVRRQILEGLDAIGIELDPAANEVRGREATISKPTSRVRVLVVPTNEELMIARDTLAITRKA